MVIIEIARECPELDRLLGEHRWREFLKKSSKQEQDQVSKVFYCTYSTGRQVQKNGESSNLFDFCRAADSSSISLIGCVIIEESLLPSMNGSGG